MVNPCDLVVTLELGERRRVVTAREIVHEHGDAGFAGKLLALLFDHSTIHGPDGERGGRGSERRVAGIPTQNAFQEILDERLRSGSGEGPGGARDGAMPAAADNDVEQLASHLAFALRDDKSLAFYRLVARAVPRAVALDALARAKDARDVKKSRAALFAFIVRPHLPRRSLTNR